MVARYRLRVHTIEAGRSFSLFGQYFASDGISVNQISLHPGKDVSLPPFVGAHSLLEEMGDETSSSISTVDDDGLDRDLLGEMDIAARIMLTGGEPQEDERLTRSNRLLIRQAILHAAKETERRTDTVLTKDVAEALPASYLLKITKM